MVSPENIHTGNIIWTQHVVFRNTYVCTKEVMNLKDNGEGSIRGFGGKNGQGKLL